MVTLLLIHEKAIQILLICDSAKREFLIEMNSSDGNIYEGFSFRK